MTRPEVVRRFKDHLAIRSLRHETNIGGYPELAGS